MGGSPLVTVADDQDSFALFSCTDGQILKYDSFLGGWFCEQDNDTLFGLNCSDGDTVRYSVPEGWICSPEE